MIYIVMANSIFARSEDNAGVAWAEKREDLVSWLDAQRYVNPETGEKDSWKDVQPNMGYGGDGKPHTYYKHFKKGAPMENFNLPGDPHSNNYATEYGTGVVEHLNRQEWVEQAGRKFDAFIASLIQAAPIKEGTFAPEKP
jgi:hypothetical protein